MLPLTNCFAKSNLYFFTFYYFGARLMDYTRGEIMQINEWIFLAVLLGSAIGAVFWTIKIHPKRGGLWVYIVWLLLVNMISLAFFNPWGMLG